MFDVYFKSGSYGGQGVSTDKAVITDKLTGDTINDGFRLFFKSSVSFRIDLQPGYENSDITVKASHPSNTLTKDSEGYYEFTLNEPWSDSIIITGIELDSHDGNFIIDGGQSEFDESVMMSYRKYDEDGYQSGRNTEVMLYSTRPTFEDVSVPVSGEFKFCMWVNGNLRYRFDYEGETEKDLTYNPSSPSDPFNSIINTAYITGVDQITYRVDSSKTYVEISFKNVTNELDVRVKPPLQIGYYMNFSASEGMGDHIKVYHGQQFSIGDLLRYFIPVQQIFGPGAPALISAPKGHDYYFIVDLFDKKLTFDPGGVTCTITEGDGTISSLADPVFLLPNAFITLPPNQSTVKVFKLSEVESGRITVNIGGIHFVNRDVNFNIGDGENATATVTNYANNEKIVNNERLEIPEGGELKFKIEADQGYHLDDINKQVVVRDSQNQPVSFEFVWFANHVDITISNVQKNLSVSINLDTEKIPITFNPVEGFQYYKVTPNENGTDFSVNTANVIRGIITTPYESDLYFAVKADTGYDLNSAVLKENETNMEKVTTTETEGGVYSIFKISSVKSSTNITGSISKIKYAINFERNSVIKDTDLTTTVTYLQDGTEIAGNQLAVSHGGSTSFQAKLEDQCNQSDLKVLCLYEGGGERELTAVNGTYSITDVTQNMTVKVENLTLNRYVINFVATNSAYYLVNDDGASEDKITSGTRIVTYGGNYEFGVEAKPGYVIGTDVIVNLRTASGINESLKPNLSSGKYTVANIRENCTVTIENVDDVIYDINLSPVDGVTYFNDTGSVISGKLKIKYGQNFEFGVSIDDAYDDSIAGMYIIVNDGQSSNVSAQKLASGRYIIPNITETVTIKVGNIRKNRYTVTLTKIEGIDYYGTSGKIITGDNEVEHKDALTFKVYLHPAYSDSKITVMLGDNKLTGDSSGVYTIPGIDENKTVTVLGVKTNKEVELVNKINNFPDSVKDLSDVSLIIETTKMYNDLSSEKKKNVTNIETLQKFQEQVKRFHHTNNDVTVQGLDWYVKLVAVPISSSAEACSRIYKKLGSEYILSLYDVYLWDTLNNRRYNLPENQTVIIALPMPDMTYFENPTGIHEKSDGKLDYLSLTFKGNTTIFETGSFSPMGVIAKRSSTPGRSSLLDAVDANVEAIKDFALTNYNSNLFKKSDSDGTSVYIDTESETDKDPEDLGWGNISEQFKSRNNKLTVQGSALRLILVLMIIILIAVSVWVVIKNRKQRKGKSKS